MLPGVLDNESSLNPIALPIRRAVTETDAREFHRSAANDEKIAKLQRRGIPSAQTVTSSTWRGILAGTAGSVAAGLPSKPDSNAISGYGVETARTLGGFPL